MAIFTFRFETRADARKFMKQYQFFLVRHKEGRELYRRHGTPPMTAVLSPSGDRFLVKIR